MKTAKILLLAALFTFVPNGPFAQITIGSTPGASESWAYFFNLSGGSSQTYAQVITVPTSVDRVLLDFSFQIWKTVVADLSFTAAVAEWSGNQIGAPVWTQTGFSTSTIAGGVGSSATFTFNPNVSLDCTKTYALLVLADVSSDLAYASITFADDDPGNTRAGTLYGLSKTTSVADLSDLAGLGWASYAGTYDLAFSANFGPVSAVPEPSIPGLALGLSGLAGYAAWRRKRTATLSCAHQGSAPSNTGPAAPLP
jgi:MYXO-CTERM domain-containing protein